MQCVPLEDLTVKTSAFRATTTNGGVPHTQKQGRKGRQLAKKITTTDAAMRATEELYLKAVKNKTANMYIFIEM